MILNEVKHFLKDPGRSHFKFIGIVYAFHFRKGTPNGTRDSPAPVARSERYASTKQTQSENQ